MDRNSIDGLAANAAERHKTYLLGIIGATSIALDSPMFEKRLDQRGLTLALTTLAASRYRVEKKMLLEQSITLATAAYNQALLDVGVTGFARISTPELIDHVAGMSVIAGEHLLAQTQRDKNMAIKRLRTAALKISITQRDKRMTRSQALIAIRRQSREGMKFDFKDRAGKSWSSSTYIYSMMREHYLSVYNEVYLYTLAKHGTLVAHVTHPDPNHKHFGMKIATLIGGPDIPSYAAISREVFHPNSRAALTI